MDNEMKRALSSAMCEIERKCKGLVCNMPDEAWEIRACLYDMGKIISRAHSAMVHMDAGKMRAISEEIKEQRLKEYENRETEEEREKARPSGERV